MKQDSLMFVAAIIISGSLAIAFLSFWGRQFLTFLKFRINRSAIKAGSLAIETNKLTKEAGKN